MRDATEALIVIDMQNDFCPGGKLAVAEGDLIVAGINALIGEFSTVVLTQDWHPADHSSFASNHPGAAAFSVTEMPYGMQVLWPDHCIQNSEGAEFHPELRRDRVDLVVRKGFRPEIDSYSAFFENDRETATELADFLTARGITTLTFVGLATDFCVAWSALDAVKLGFRTTLRLDLSRGIDNGGTMEEAMAQMEDAGVVLVDIE